MNRPSKPNRQESKLWKRYSAAGMAMVAAGVATQEAEGAILYTSGVNLTITPSTPGLLYFDLEGSGSTGISTNLPSSTDFGFFFSTNENERLRLDTYSSYGENAGQQSGPKFFLGMFAVNDVIGSSLPTTWNGNQLANLEYNGSGSWEGGGMGFVALRIETPGGGSYNYGWARINYDDTANTMTLMDFAYQNTVNQSIVAGDTGAGVVPEPSRTLLLALGVGGAALRRRRQKA